MAIPTSIENLKYSRIHLRFGLCQQNEISEKKEEKERLGQIAVEADIIEFFISNHQENKKKKFKKWKHT